MGGSRGETEGSRQSQNIGELRHQMPRQFPEVTNDWRSLQEQHETQEITATRVPTMVDERDSKKLIEARGRRPFHSDHTLEGSCYGLIMLRDKL